MYSTRVRKDAPEQNINLFTTKIKIYLQQCFFTEQWKHAETTQTACPGYSEKTYQQKIITYYAGQCRCLPPQDTTDRNTP